MIYRVEFNKDGSVSSCASVESHLKNGGLVVYIEASSQESAIERAKKNFYNWNSREREKARNKGLCPRCFRRPVAKGENCDNCRKEDREYRAKMKQMTAAEGEAYSDRQAEMRKKRSEALRLLLKKGNAVLRAASDSRWDAGRVPKSKGVQLALRQALRAYDRDPRNFRTWLVERLVAHQSSHEATAAE